MSNKKPDNDQEARQASEIEASQNALRESIAETERLVDDAEAILKRHRKERADRTS